MLRAHHKLGYCSPAALQDVPDGGSHGERLRAGRASSSNAAEAIGSMLQGLQGGYHWSPAVAQTVLEVLSEQLAAASVKDQSRVVMVSSYLLD